MILECPNCREPVSFLRSVRTTAWGSFPCRVCGSILGISFTRRVVAAGIWLATLLFVMEFLRLYAFGRWVMYGLMVISLVVALYLFEKIVLIEVLIPGSSAPAATATKPASKAYSTRSWPFSSSIS